MIVECNAWTLPQERYNAEWIVEKEVGLVLKNFRGIDNATALLIEPDTLARYRANAAALHNRAIFEIPEMLGKIHSNDRKRAPRRDLPPNSPPNAASHFARAPWLCLPHPSLLETRRVLTRHISGDKLPHSGGAFR